MTLHWYGFFIAIGIGLAWWLCKKLVWEGGKDPDLVDEIILWVSVPTLIGARAWHVLTDWQLYVEQPLHMLFFWQGGLSILGALLGGVAGVFLWVWCTQRNLRQEQKWTEILWWLDVAVWGLPVAQSIGRVGNFLNQELFGLPTYLPWGIEIAQAYRVSGWQAYSQFHPLFAYEAVILAVMAGVIWRYRKSLVGMLGRGWIFVGYIAFYSWLRVGLESIKIQKTLIPTLGIGLNQGVLVVVGVIATLWLIRSMKIKVPQLLLLGGSILAWLWLCIAVAHTVPVVSSCRNEVWESIKVVLCADQNEYFQSQYDHHFTVVSVGDTQLTVEIVNTPSSITQGLSSRQQLGSDGMLFLLPSPLTVPHFWMKDMWFDLDLVWIHDDRIMSVSRDAEAPRGDMRRSLPIYQPTKPANLVLEVPAGTAAANGWMPETAFKWYH